MKNTIKKTDSIRAYGYAFEQFETCNELRPVMVAHIGDAGFASVREVVDAVKSRAEQLGMSEVKMVRILNYTQSWYHAYTATGRKIF